MHCSFCDNTIDNIQGTEWNFAGWRQLASVNGGDWMCRDCQDNRYFLCDHKVPTIIQPGNISTEEYDCDDICWKTRRFAR